MDHINSADVSKDPLIDAKHIDWTWNQMQFFNHEDEIALQKVIKD
jgi:hypothetical protein